MRALLIMVIMLLFVSLHTQTAMDNVYIQKYFKDVIHNVTLVYDAEYPIAGRFDVIGQYDCRIVLRDKYDYVTLAHELAHAWKVFRMYEVLPNHEEYGVDAYGVSVAIETRSRINFGREADLLAYLIKDATRPFLTFQERSIYRRYAAIFYNIVFE
jgi:hypothetical protein